MKDQIDNLRRLTGMHSAIDAIYGLHNSRAWGRLREAYIRDTPYYTHLPEQLRNKRFRDAIAQRNIGCWVFDEAHCLSKWGTTSVLTPLCGPFYS